MIKHPRDWNLTREAALGAGLHPHTPAYDVQRACGTSLTAAIQIGQRIALGEIEAGIAGGVDTTSDVPIGYGRALNRIALDSARGRTWRARIGAVAQAEAGGLEACGARRGRTAHRLFDGRALRAEWPSNGASAAPSRTSWRTGVT